MAIAHSKAEIVVISKNGEFQCTFTDYLTSVSSMRTVSVLDPDLGAVFISRSDGKAIRISEISQAGHCLHYCSIPSVRRRTNMVSLQSILSSRIIKVCRQGRDRWVTSRRCLLVPGGRLKALFLLSAKVMFCNGHEGQVPHRRVRQT